MRPSNHTRTQAMCPGGAPRSAPIPHTGGISPRLTTAGPSPCNLLSKTGERVVPSRLRLLRRGRAALCAAPQPPSLRRTARAAPERRCKYLKVSVGSHKKSEGLFSDAKADSHYTSCEASREGPSVTERQLALAAHRGPALRPPGVAGRSRGSPLPATHTLERAGYLNSGTPSEWRTSLLLATPEMQSASAAAV